MRAGPPDVDGGSKLQGDWVSEHGPLSFLVLGAHWAVKAFTEVPCHLQLQGSAPDVQNCLLPQGPGCGTRQHVATCSLKQSRAQTSWPAPLESKDLRSSQPSTTAGPTAWETGHAKILVSPRTLPVSSTLCQEHYRRPPG